MTVVELKREQQTEVASDLYERLEAVIDQVRSRNKLTSAFRFFPNSSPKYKALALRSIELQTRLAGELDIESLAALKKEVLSVEIEAQRLTFRYGIMPVVFILYAGLPSLYLLARRIDWNYFLHDVLGIAAPGKPIALGIAGALVYLATSGLKAIEAGSGIDKQIAKVLETTIRIALAVVVPIVIVALFVKADGKFGSPTATTDLLAFACGYSTKLAIDILRKIVEKASKMVDAI